MLGKLTYSVFFFLLVITGCACLNMHSDQPLGALPRTCAPLQEKRSRISHSNWSNSFLATSDTVPLGKKSRMASIPLAVLIPDLESEIKMIADPNSKIKNATLELLKGRLNRTIIKVYYDESLKDGRRGIKELQQPITFTPKAKGSFTKSGILWNWKLTGLVGEVEISNEAEPAFTRFQIDIRLDIDTRTPTVDTKFVQIVSAPDRWFFIVAGRGEGQDCTLVPRNAPACPCGCGDGPTCACAAARKLERKKP
jgi:hypothetical protein